MIKASKNIFCFILLCSALSAYIVSFEIESDLSKLEFTGLSVICCLLFTS